MAIQFGATPFIETTVTAFNPLAATPTASRICVPAPHRGRIVECGFMPGAAINSQMTMQVAINDQSSATASTFNVTAVTSTLGNFSSANMFEGAPCSVVPATNVFVNRGDGIQFTTSGGHSSTVGATMYAIIRRA